jgi:hypothetical protein
MARIARGGRVRRVVCVEHWKRLEYTEKTRKDDGTNKRTVVTAPKCPLHGKHSYMHEANTTKEQFEMFWQQAI